MQRDIRETALYREVQALHSALREPGTGQISDAADLHVAPGGGHAAFTALIMDLDDEVPSSRLCEIDLLDGSMRLLTCGPHTDRLPKYSPDCKRIAFLSDRHNKGDLQLYLLDRATGAVRAAGLVDGWVEYLHWSPDGGRVLLGVAGHGADISGGQGAVTSSQRTDQSSPWMPSVNTANEAFRWRQLWVFELSTGALTSINLRGLNPWEAAWCGNGAVAFVGSLGPNEGRWYSAELFTIELGKSAPARRFHPADQIGWPSASPSGKLLAIVEAVCSDRWLVAGELRIIDLTTNEVHRVATGSVDITYAEWRSESHLLVAGHRGHQTVVGIFDAAAKTFRETWSSSEVTTGGYFVTVSGVGDEGDCGLIGEGFYRAPEIAMIECGAYRTVRPFELGYRKHADAIAAVEHIVWSAPDGLEIDGLLLLPKGRGPYPTVMNIHGGPVWAWRPRWLGRAHLHTLTLIKKGFAVFFPNPRGSAGRGQAFSRLVLGDMGGADTYDYLSGLDHLVAKGIADRSKLGVTGASYGGYMSSWLITQDSRFAAAVSVAPVTNKVTQYLLSNIPEFVSLFLADRYDNPAGKFFERSPVMHAHKARTPILNVCGALDRCTPPQEAAQFHQALVEHGVESILITYPLEGHGIRKFPAVIDFTTRAVDWFLAYMPPSVVRNGPNG